MELRPTVGAGVESVDVVWIGSCVGLAPIDDYHVVAPEGGGMATAFCRWGGRVGQWSYTCPFKGFDVETIHVVIDYLLSAHTQSTEAEVVNTVIGVPVKPPWKSVLFY